MKLGVAFASSIILAASCGRASGDARTPPGEPSNPASAAVTIPPPEDASVAESERDEELTEAIPDAGTGAPRAQSTLSPTVIARGAIARMHPHGPRERSVVLLRSPARPKSCLLSSDDPEIVMMACNWQAGNNCVSQHLTMRDGGQINYRVRIRVLTAPTQKGARGAIELEDSDDTNVHGGKLEVLVCD